MSAAQRTLGLAGVSFLEGRGLNPEIAARLGVYTARHDRALKDVVPDNAGNIIVFPFIQHDVIVAEKYRGPDKRFWQRAGCKRIFYNWDAMLDPALQDGRMPLVIVEGEPDCLAAIDCGFPLTVSVPDGAPAVPIGSSPDNLPELDARTEESGKFDFVYESRAQLKVIKRFVVAVDNDAPGQRLAAELVRRLGAARCAFVVYPEGCKDINDVLMRHGPAEVARVINDARPYPVRGLYRISEAPSVPDLVTCSTGWEKLDAMTAGSCRMQVYAGALMVVTGIPGSGKSTWVCNMVVNLAKQYRWSAAVFSPEMPMVPFYRDLLRDVIAKKVNEDGEEFMAYDADKFIEQHFSFITNDPSGGYDEDMTLEWLLEKAVDAVLRYGIRVLVIDPYNEIEHARRNGESVTDYISRALRAIKRFAQQYGVLAIVIAHPTKDVAKGHDGSVRVPSLYDIEGSAHWFNKTDFGVIVDRQEGEVTQIYVAKVRFKQTGYRGSIKLKFDSRTSRYVTYSPTPELL